MRLRSAQAGHDRTLGLSKGRNSQGAANAWDHNLTLLDLSPITASAVVSLFALICFVDSIRGDFVFDDSEVIVNNNDIRWDAPVSDVFRHDFWGTRLTHPSSHKSYRPFTILSFRLNHLVSGLSPVSYHAFNVALHCLVSVAALHVFVRLLRGSRQCAVLAALLFATHPIHTEAVAGVVGRADLLCALFVFCALLAYIKAVKEDMRSCFPYNQTLSGGEGFLGGTTNGVSGGTRRQQCRGVVGGHGGGDFLEGYHRCRGKKWLAVCALCTTVALLCKEVGITALGLCSAYEVLMTSCGVQGGGLFCYLPIGRHRRVCQQKNYGCVVRRHAVLCAVGLLLLLGRWLIMGSAVPRFMHVDNPASFMDDVFYRALNYQYIYLLNCVLMLAPLWLCFDWSMGCVPLIESVTDARVMAIPLLWAGLALLLRRGLYIKGNVSSCVLVSLALSVVPFLPATNVFFRVGFVIAERVLYLPVAGLCCLVALGMREMVLLNWLNKRAVLLLYCAVLCVFVLRCRQRTIDWCTERQLFRTGLQVCPLNAKVHYNLGKVASDNNNLPEAVAYYKEAIRLNPDYDRAMNNLANILKDEGSLQEALQLLQSATSLRPDFAAAWMNLGIVQASLGQLEEAQTSYTTALTHRPVYPDCLYNLGNLFLERGMSDAALNAWRNATALKPSLARAWINTLILLDSQHQYEQVVQTAYRALQHLPDDSSLHFNLANTLGKLNRYTESETHFLHATRLDPLNANYWSNLGVLYHRWKKFKDAEATYKHTLNLKPDLKSAQDNLSKLRKSIAGNRPIR